MKNQVLLQHHNVLEDSKTVGEYLLQKNPYLVLKSVVQCFSIYVQYKDVQKQLTVHSRFTVGALKEQINSLFSQEIYICLCSVYFNSILMEDDRTLESYGIQQDNVVLIKNKADDLKEKSGFINISFMCLNIYQMKRLQVNDREQLQSFVFHLANEFGVPYTKDQPLECVFFYKNQFLHPLSAPFDYQIVDNSELDFYFVNTYSFHNSYFDGAFLSVNEQCSQFRPCQPQSIDPFFIHQYFFSLHLPSSLQLFNSLLFLFSNPLYSKTIQTVTISTTLPSLLLQYTFDVTDYRLQSLLSLAIPFQTIESHLLPFLEYLQTHTYLHSIHTLSIYEPSLSPFLRQSLSKFKESAPFTLIVNDKPIVDLSSQDYQQKYTHLLELYHHLQSSYQTLLTTPKVHQHHPSSSSTTIQPPPVPTTPPPVFPPMPTNSPPVYPPMLTNPPPVYPPNRSSSPSFPYNQTQAKQLVNNKKEFGDPKFGLSSMIPETKPLSNTNSHRVDPYPSGIQRISHSRMSSTGALETTFMRGPTIPVNQSTEQGPLSNSSLLVASSSFPFSASNNGQKENADYNKTKVIYAYNDSYKYTHIASSSLYDYYYTPTTATLFYKYINEYKFTNVEFLFLANMNIMDSGFISFCNCMRSLTLPSLKCGYFQNNNIGYEGMNALVNMYKDLHAKRITLKLEMIDLSSNPISLKGESCIEELVKLNISKPLRFLILFYYQIRNPSLLSYANKNNQNFLILSNELFYIFSNEDITLVNQLVYTPSHKDSLIHIENIKFSYTLFYYVLMYIDSTQSQQVTQFHIKNCGLNDDSFKLLYDSLHKNIYSPIVSVQLSGNTLTYKSAAYIANALKKGNLSYLRVLCLDNNPIGDQGILGIMSALKDGSFPSLQTISFSNCNLKTSARDILEFLNSQKCMNTIKYFNISNNQFDSNSIIQFKNYQRDRKSVV